MDIAPLVGDNRALARMGLQHLNRGLVAGGARPGIEALVKVAGVRGAVDEQDLGWKLGPRINSIGRIKNPRPALDLMLTDDRREALIMRFSLGMSNREIARALGRTDGATKVLIHRSIKQLQEELARTGADDE